VSINNPYQVQYPGPDLGLVRPQATVISTGTPTTPHPNYINNFITILLNAFRGIVILHPFFLYLLIWGLLECGGPHALLLLLLCKSTTANIASKRVGLDMGFLMNEVNFEL